MVLKNWQKLLSDAVHVLNADPCRMFVYGVSPLIQQGDFQPDVMFMQISIENARVAVWHIARDRCMRSRSFQFTEVRSWYLSVCWSDLLV
jgi:hypothetical protein